MELFWQKLNCSKNLREILESNTRMDSNNSIITDEYSLLVESLDSLCDSHVFIEKTLYVFSTQGADPRLPHRIKITQGNGIMKREKKDIRTCPGSGGWKDASQAEDLVYSC